MDAQTKAALKNQMIKQAYFEKIGYAPHPGQALFHQSDARFRFANCGRRFGKAEAITNEIPMADGTFKLMRDVQAGDFVLGPNGKPAEVVGTTGEMLNRECAKVIFNDGTEIVVDKEHLWQVVDKGARKALTETNTRRIYHEKVLTTAQMQETVHVGKKKESNYAIPLIDFVRYPTQNLPVDPYLLGVWLGDGSKDGNIITTADEEILESITDLGFTYKRYSQYGYYVHGLRQELQNLYVFDYVDSARNTKSLVGEKFVPEQYLIGDFQQRMAILQGLMDTDGTIGKNGHVQFTSTTKQLADSVHQLVTSLGMKAHRYTRKTSYQYKGQKLQGKLSYTVHFWPHKVVFRLSRKQSLIHSTSSPIQQYRFITDIVDNESVPVKCIKVARADGLYLTSRNYVVTHNSLMVARDLEPYLLQPNKHYWIVGPTYDLAEKEFRVIWRDMIIGLKLGKDPGIDKVYNKRGGTMFINFKRWNTLLEVKSAQNPENLVGESLDKVIMSEAAKHTKETWDRYIRPALGDRRGGADFVTTPEGFNWLYDEWMHGQDPSFIDYDSWKFPSWMNTVIFPGGEQDPEIQLLRRTMSPSAFTQEIGADFGSFVGKIYGDWDVSKHVKPHTYRPDWPNYIAFDFGFTNPTAAIEFQVSPRDEIFIWREYYKSFTRLETVLSDLKSREQPPGYHINLTFGDAADPEAIESINEHFAPCVGDPNAKTNWRDGIDLVNSFLMRDDGEDEFGGPLQSVPALFVDPTCLNTISEFNNYRADPKSNGTNTAESARKQDDHAMDAIRYGLVHIYKLGAVYSLSDAIEIKSTSTVPAIAAQPATDGEHKPKPRPNVKPSQLGDVNDSISDSGYDELLNSGSGLVFASGGAEGFFTQIGEF